MKSAFIEGSTFYLRGLEERDLEGNYPHWFNDPEVCRFNSHGRFPATLPKMRAYVQHAQSAANELILAIILKQKDRHVGNIALQRIDWIDRSAQYSILVGEKEAWGKGIATEASRLLLRHAFESLNLHRVYCATSEKNVAMQKLAKAMGMAEEGRRRQAFFKEGQYLDLLEYGILRSEFKTR